MAKNKGNGKTTSQVEPTEVIRKGASNARIFEKNRRGLKPYQKRKLKLSNLHDGLVYKSKGICEHNMFLTVAKRMKHRSACVSPQGGLELCKLLCYKESSTLIETIEKLPALEISERLRVGSIKPILGEEKLRKKEGRWYERKHTNLLFANCAISKGRKWLISWLKEKVYSNSYF